jgi:hypothetical protein
LEIDAQRNIDQKKYSPANKTSSSYSSYDGSTIERRIQYIKTEQKVLMIIFSMQKREV